MNYISPKILLISLLTITGIVSCNYCFAKNVYIKIEKYPVASETILSDGKYIIADFIVTVNTKGEPVSITWRTRSATAEKTMEKRVEFVELEFDDLTNILWGPPATPNWVDEKWLEGRTWTLQSNGDITIRIQGRISVNPDNLPHDTIWREIIFTISPPL